MRKFNLIKFSLVLYSALLIAIVAIFSISVIKKEQSVISADACGGCPSGWMCYHSTSGVSPNAYFCLAPVGFSDFSTYPRCSLSSPGLRECDGIPLNPGQTTYCTTTQGNDFYVCSPGSATQCTFDGGASCNCDMNVCEEECRQVFAGQPGSHIYKRRCLNCDQIFACSCEIGNGGGGGGGFEGCPYESTQARVHQNTQSPWQENLQLICGQQFIVGSFHDNTGRFANDTEIRVVGPNMNFNNAPNGAVFQTEDPGTYTIYVRTRIPGSSDFYTESACNAQTTVVCSTNNGEAPSFTISKLATNNDSPYDIGEIVNFRVEITNTGNITLSEIAYRDVFDNRFLRFVSAVGISSNNPNGVNLTNHFNFTNSGHITTLSLNDITQLLGDLSAGQSIYIDFSFIALSASARACNDAFANPAGLSEEQARACVSIIVSTDL